MAEEQGPTVAYLGPEASYTHQATLSYFPPTTSPTSNPTLQPSTTIADVFSAVHSGAATYGVVPFENSSNGSVVATLDLFADVAAIHPSIEVCGEAYVEVRHCLLGRLPTSTSTSSSSTLSTSPSISTPSNSEADKSRARPLCDLSNITLIYSHPQAWGQCTSFLTTYLKGIERRDVSSTSYAAELVAADQSGRSAALSSEIAARMFGLDVLARTVNDRRDNETRFLVIRKRKRGDQDRAGTVSVRAASDGTTTTTTTTTEGQYQFKSLITFTLPTSPSISPSSTSTSTAPGALASPLSILSSHGINLTSINTRPSGRRKWDYIFFVEFVGQQRREEGNEVDKALNRVEEVCRGLRFLGSWESRGG